MQRRTRKVFHSEQNELEKWRALARSLDASMLPDIREANFISNNCKVFHFVNPTGSFLLLSFSNLVHCSVTSNTTFLFGEPSVNGIPIIHVFHSRFRVLLPGYLASAGGGDPPSIPPCGGCHGTRGIDCFFNKPPLLSPLNVVVGDKTLIAVHRGSKPVAKVLLDHYHYASLRSPVQTISLLAHEDIGINV